MTTVPVPLAAGATFTFRCEGSPTAAGSADDSFSFNSPFLTIKPYTGSSLVSRCIFIRNRSQNSVCSISGICLVSEPTGNFAVMSHRSDAIQSGTEIW